MLGLAFLLTFSYSTLVTDRLATLASSISADIQNPHVRVKIVGRTVILEGVATDPSESDRCEAIAIDYLASQSSGVFFGATRVLNMISIQATEQPRTTAFVF